MNRLRDWLLGRCDPIDPPWSRDRIPFETPPDGVGFYASPIPSGGARPEGVTPLSPEWREKMGRCGADCHIRDHHDALQRLGHAIAEQQRLRFDRDTWRERALRAEGKLRHPSTGERAA